MAVIPILEKAAVDALPADLKKEYRPGTKEENLEGKFVLDVSASNGWALENVTGLRSALEHVRAEATNYRTTLTKFGNVKPEEVAELQTKYKALNDQLTAGGDKVTIAVNAAVSEIKTAHEREKSKWETERTTFNSAIDSLVIDTAATLALQSKGGNPDFLLHHVKSQLKTVWKDGKATAIVIDPQTGNPRITLKPNSTDPMGIDELVGIMAEDKRFKGAFAGTKAAGAGMSGSMNSNGAGDDTAGMTPQQRIAEHHRKKSGG